MEEEYVLTLSDLPQGCRLFAEYLGLPRFMEIAEAFGGQVIYIPNLIQLRTEIRNRSIRAAYHGKPREIRQLSRKYKLSERQIRNIVRK